MVMGDDLATPRTAAFPQAVAVAVDEVTVGRRQDGQPYVLTMKSRHTLFAGCSDSGKGSWLWGVCGGLAPAVRRDLVRLWGIDLKGGMEVGMGAHLFTATAYTPGDAVSMLRHLLDVADKRTRAMRGASRFHRPTPGDPVHVLVIDELASLIAYETDAQKRTEAARLLSRLLSIGRAPGVLVVAFVQDPAKETVSMRNLFTQTVALRLRSAEETRMVLGDGMAAKAPAHKIDETTPGVAWVVEGDHADRVRADYWTDDLIRAVAHEYAAPVASPLPNSDDTHTGTVVAGETVTDTTTGRKPRKPRKPRAPRAQQDQDRTDEAA